MDFVPGALVAGRYRLTRMVGSGGMGEVWSGEDNKTNTKVAVKHLLPAAAKHHEVVARFKREAYLLGRVESEYVARVVDFFDDELYGLVLVMEFIEGPSLAHILEQRTLSFEEAVDLAFDLLRALQDLHTSKIVHRDLKPGNIIMKPMPGGVQRAIVVDFGISRLLPDKGENEVTGITRANIALGTVEYMAPEQILNSRDVTTVTDLYAVGIILFRSIKGHHAFGDRRGEELARAKLIEEPPPLETRRQDEVAKGMTALIVRALKKKPSQRYQSAEHMLDEVRALREAARRNIDLDDATTDGSGDQDTAIKHSLVARGADGIAELPPMRQSRPGLPPPGGSSKVEIRTQPTRPVGGGTLALGGAAVSPAQPMPKPPPRPAAGAPPAETPTRASAASPAARGSLPSIPEVLPSTPPPGMDANQNGAAVTHPASSPAPAPAPRASLASLPEYSPAMMIPPHRQELTMVGAPSSTSKWTIGLAVLTAFAVGTAVGLIVAPTQAPVTKSECPKCATAAPTMATDTETATTAAIPPASQAPASSSSSPTAPSGSASASGSAKLSGRIPSSTVSVRRPDGFGEEDPPRPRPTNPPTMTLPLPAPTPVYTAPGI